MSTGTNFTYGRAMVYGVLTELLLVLAQFVILKDYTHANPDSDFAFSSAYMMSTGFYVFQVVGFFNYFTVVFTLMRKIKEKPLYKILALILAGAVVELTFYALAQADYQIAYFYSVLDKLVAGAFGTIVYYYTTADE
ncbi:MAG: hypothetical protein RIF39_03115 [Cyclobacteriaceae bacterium]